MDINLRLNEAYAPLVGPEGYASRTWIVYGGAGSGKSYAVAQTHVLGALTDPGRGYLVVRKTARSLRTSVFELLKSVISDLGVRRYFDIRESDMRFTCRNGSRIILDGLDTVEKLKSIHDITDVWGEEANELDEPDVRQLNLRMRGIGHPKRMVLTFNPILDTHWLKRAYFDSPQPNTRILKTTYLDNAFLDPEYRAELEALKDIDRYFYQVYALGEWGQLGDVVFSNFVIEDFPYGEDDLENVRGGIDFGWNDPNVIERVGFKDGELYIFDEFYQSKLHNEQFIAAGKELDPRYEEHYYRGDSSRPEFIDEFNDAGWNVEGAKKGDNSIFEGISFLKRFRVHIHKTRCPGIAKEWPAYHWRKDRQGNVLDKPVDYMNHGIDAVRYALEEMWADGGEVGVWVL